MSEQKGNKKLNLAYYVFWMILGLGIALSFMFKYGEINIALVILNIVVGIFIFGNSLFQIFETVMKVKEKPFS